MIKASWDISNTDTLKREVAGLTEAARYMNCDELMIITSDNETEINQDNLLVKVVPAWKALSQK